MPTVVLNTSYILTHLNSHWPHDIGSAIIPHFTVETLRHREVREPAQGDPARRIMYSADAYVFKDIINRFRISRLHEKRACLPTQCVDEITEALMCLSDSAVKSQNQFQREPLDFHPVGTFPDHLGKGHNVHKRRLRVKRKNTQCH